MLLTETDSLMYKVKMFMSTSTMIKQLFDFSNQPKGSKYYHNANNLFAAKIKNETCNLPLKGFVGLKSKTDTFITEDNDESEKVKNTNKIFLDEELTH